jgi:hypothetical protein
MKILDLSKEFHPVPKPLARVKMPKAMKTEGKKTIGWTEKRNELKIEFAKKKITKCELKLKGCWINNALGFAHTKKRRKLTIEELGEVVLACTPCHDQIEYIPAEDMEKILLKIIWSRKV